jgi:hypothetical protein
VGPIVTAARDQANTITVPLNAKAVDVVFHFVEPVRAVRDDGGLGRDAELQGLKHVANISIRRGLLRRRPSDTKGSFLAGWDRSSGLILQRGLAAFGCRNAALKLVWRRTVTGPKLSTPDRSHEGAADRFRLHPSRRLPAPRWRLRSVLSIHARRKD